MPQTKLLFYKEADGSVPVKQWLDELLRTDRNAFANCVERMQRLATLDHELRRPHADLLRDDVFELRARHGNINYRVLYFFHGKDIAVLAHWLTINGKVPDADIERAVRRKNALEQDPAKHVYEENDDGEDTQDQ